MFHIALDAMGGDFAPTEIVKGAFLARNSLSSVHIHLVGPTAQLKSEIKRLGESDLSRITLVEASETIKMCESPAVAFRQKKDSSIHVGLNLLKAGDVSAFVSAGNTGAVMMASTLILGRVPDVERPAIASLIPTSKGRPVVMLDMGSSVDCKPEHLAQFATMGECFARTVLNEDSPRVGLLNIGEEQEKGNQQVQAAYDLIDALPLNFIGNVEGKDILRGKADVVVCDGFVGNSVLKFGEGISEVFFNFFRQEAKGGLLSRLGMICLLPALKTFKKQFDPEEYGGAPLLGVKGISIIAHGSSSARAIKNAIRSAIKEVESRVVDEIDGAIHR